MSARFSLFKRGNVYRFDKAQYGADGLKNQARFGRGDDVIVVGKRLVVANVVEGLDPTFRAGCAR